MSIKPYKLKEFKKATLSDLTAICIEISDFIEEPALIILDGPVGAGKTTFTQAYLAMLNHHYTTSSPSYALVHELGDILHADFYRIDESAELIHLELPMLLEDKRISFMEWADPFLDALLDEVPEKTLLYKVSIEVSGEQQEFRDFTFYTLQES